jgi:hypothetical protein
MLKALLTAVVLLLTYCLIPVYVGHGEVSTAFVLVGGVVGRVPTYLSIAVLGWVGISGLLVATALLARRRPAPRLLAGSVGILLLSWVGLVWVTETRELTLVASIPFLLVTAWILFLRGRVGGSAQSPTNGGVQV